MYRERLTHLPTLIDHSSKSGIGNEYVNIVKEMNQIKNEHFNQLQHPTVLENLCDSEIPVDALIPTRKHHQLQSVGSFENLKYKKYVEQYRQKNIQLQHHWNGGKNNQLTKRHFHEKMA